MKTVLRAFGIFAGLALLAQTPPVRTALQQQNEVLFEQLQRVQGLSDTQMKALRQIFAKSGYISQGNPAVTRHPMTPEQAQAKLNAAGINYSNPQFEKICGGKYMAPLYDPAKERPEDAKACIDQFEFPDIPTAYPVVWVKAREAAEICEAEGKRICDAHEWEGACAGELEPPDYEWDLAKGLAPNAADRTDAGSPQPEGCGDEELELWPGVPEGHLRHIKPKNSGLQRGQLDRMRLQHLSRRAPFPDCHSPLGFTI